MSKMPVAFIGHGSPMNAIEDNIFTMGWKKIAEDLPKPKAIISVSAHWYTEGTRITGESKPRTIYDFYGFPKEIYNIEYPAQGFPELALRVKNLLGSAVLDTSWGYDHGTWSILSVMYPDADIPVIQVSIDASADISDHFYLAEKMKELRDEGILFIGSGNVVHNLGRVSFEKPDGYDWAVEFDKHIQEKVKARAFEDVIDYRHFGKSANLSVPTPDHFIPLLYILGLAEKDESIRIYNDECVNGGLSMTSYVIGL